MEETVIGKISATEKMPSTIDDFYFWTDKTQILSPFDIVKVDHVAPNNGKSITYGVVEEISHVTDAQSHFASFISSDFGDTSENIGNMERLGMNYVRAKVVCNTENVYSPVLDGRLVRLCDDEDIKIALGLKNVSNPLVCGYLQMYQGKMAKRVKVELNSHFLLGPEGAHMNISGISGLAAKTSYSMFLLNAIQQTSNDKEQPAFVLFNVKGRDLLAIDEPNKDLSDDDNKLYEYLGLKSVPFQNVKFYYPYQSQNSVQSYVDTKDFKRQKDNNKAVKYKFTLEKSLENLDLLLANEDDPNGTLESCMLKIMNQEGNFKSISNWDTLIKEIFECTKAGNKSADKDINVLSWRKFYRCIKKASDNDIFKNDLFEGECDIAEQIQNLRAGQVMVIDIAQLDQNTQSFVFGYVARAIYDMKLGADRSDIPQKVILFVDELNKYASSDAPKNSPILRQILEITERGRSLGIVLFGVEQFRSAIHDRVKGNCATQAYGRTNAIEISKPDYRYIPKADQNMMTRLTAGEYIISNPTLRSTINIRFPRPTYKQFPNG